MSDLISCKGKVDPFNEHIGHCNKCSTMQRPDTCSLQLSAKLIIGTQEHSHSLPAFLPMIRRITLDNTITDNTDTEEVTTKLLMADPFMLTYTANKIINAVYRTSK